MTVEPPEKEPTEGELPPPPQLKRRLVRIVGVVLLIGLVYYAFAVVLPGQVDLTQVWDTLEALTGPELLAISVAALLVMVALGWGSKASLPGLSLYKGTESSATSQVTAFVVPPPGDLVVRFAMYRTYDFTDEESGSSVLIAMIARYMAIFFMPIIGLVAVLLSGGGSAAYLWWLLGLSALFAATMWLLLKVIRSDDVAHSFGRWLQRAASRVIRLFRRTPPTDLEESVVKFGRRMRGTVDTNFKEIVAANVSWGFANVLVMILAIRFTGLDSDTLSISEIVLVTGAAMALNSIPIPGGITITTTVLLAIIDLSSEQDALFTAGLFLYRIFTFLFPMPVGGLFFFSWRWRVWRQTSQESE